MAENSDIMIKVTDATVRFNMASEKIDNLKEYFVKLIKRELMFQEFLALKDVNFEVKRGEAWGLIGTNGSGKSTLLKLICGILKPYKGTVDVYGSIAPLIELGAGFDGELTATENIYLNGAVLGYSKEFMDSHYDEIVDFAELKDFMNMPIKNYSSGMAARLGFAIATIVQPEIRLWMRFWQSEMPLSRRSARSACTRCSTMVQRFCSYRIQWQLCASSAITQSG